MKRKAEFLSELVSKTIDDERQMLTAPLIYYSKRLQRIVTVATNFVTDGASIPRWPIIYWLLGGKAKMPAAIHDWHYQTHTVRSRRQADLVLMESMMVDGLEQWRCELIYAGVRLGGGKSWYDGPARYTAIQRLQKQG